MRRVEELAVTVNWLPEEGPAVILSAEQLLVIALLLIPILLLFAPELIPFTGRSALRVGETSCKELSKGTRNESEKPYRSAPQRPKALLQSQP
jgi:hypothetical protein